jgi:hypothetical protein
MVQEFNETINALWRGSIDIHVHAAPDPVAARRQDVLEMAHAARDAGMKAVIFKSHEYPTAPVAYVVNRLLADFTVFGAISLDDEVGGLNPEALEASARMGAAKVWMPTFSADYWSTTRHNRPGIKILDEQGRLVPRVHELLDIVDRYQMILGTGHLWPEEQLALVQEARRRGLKTVVTHADMWIPVELQVEMARRGAFIEHAYLGCLPSAGYYTVQQVAAAVRATGPAACIMSTDLGQAHNPAPAEGLRMFIAAMLREGFAPNEIELMVKHNPAQLLGLE